MDMSKGELLELRLQGFSYQAIGERAGVSRQRIQQLLEPPKAVRTAVVTAADGLCKDCGADIGASGQVHHKDAVNMDGDDYNDFVNLVLLCISCHIITHRLNPGALLYPPGPLSVCNHCGHTWGAKVKYPRKCPGCQRAYPLGGPPQAVPA